MTDARVGGSAATTTWDPATKDATVTLSNGDLTAICSVVEGGNVFSTTTRSSGRYAARIVAEYSGIEADEEVAIGTGTNGAQDITGLVTTPSGAGLIALIDFSAGGVWFANDATVASVRAAAEAWLVDSGTGSAPFGTFTANAPRSINTVLYSADDASPASATLDPTYSSGTFAAWS